MQNFHNRGNSKWLPKNRGSNLFKYIVKLNDIKLIFHSSQQMKAYLLHSRFFFPLGKGPEIPIELDTCVTKGNSEFDTFLLQFGVNCEKHKDSEFSLRQLKKLFFFYIYFQLSLLNCHSWNILLSTICFKSQKDQTFKIVISLFSTHASWPVTWIRIQNQFPFHRKKCLKNSEVPHLF